MNNNKKIYIIIILGIISILVCILILIYFLTKHISRKDLCYNVTCPNDQICVDGKCSRKDLCYNVTCPNDQICVDGKCSHKDLCYNVTCPNDQICVDGKCSHKDLCYNVTCPTDQICVDGKCILYKSACFDNSIDPGIPLLDQKNHTFQITGKDNNNYNTCLQIVNGGTQTLWINWIVEETNKINSYPGPIGSATGIFSTKWTYYLNNPIEGSYKSTNNWSWANDITHAEGIFEIPPNKYVLLPYFGVSARIAGALGCSNTKSNCKIGSGGTQSPQTLIEWTWTPSGNDVIDCSTVDGYALPVRIQYLKEDNSSTTTILGKFTKENCKLGGKQIIDKDGNYLGCQSPCSAGVGWKGINQDINSQVCCKDKYNKPETCHPNRIPVAKQFINPWCDSITNMFSLNNKRLGYCYAYDDEAGSIKDHQKYNSLIKVIFCTDGFS